MGEVPIGQIRQACRVVLCRVDHRIFPAIDIERSGTLKEELLMSADTLNKVWILRKILNQMSVVEAMELLIDKISKSKNNGEFLKMMQSPAN